mgnify:CR=1 FL=1
MAEQRFAAAEALGNFVHLKSKDRKDIFEEILKTFTSVRNSVDSDPLDTIARQRFDAIAAPMITTLQVLSGHDERKAYNAILEGFSEVLKRNDVQTLVEKE